MKSKNPWSNNVRICFRSTDLFLLIDVSTIGQPSPVSSAFALPDASSDAPASVSPVASGSQETAFEMNSQSLELATSSFASGNVLNI